MFLLKLFLLAAEYLGLFSLELNFILGKPIFSNLISDEFRTDSGFFCGVGDKHEYKEGFIISNFVDGEIFIDFAETGGRLLTVLVWFEGD